jgi:mannose-1-phosphate guanylyltransferase
MTTPKFTPHASRLTPHARKAMVLAAGLGTRLRPLTDHVPKCLVPLAGRPLLDWTLRWLSRAGVSECVINLHYLPDKVRELVGDGTPYEMQVKYSYEPELLGTAGAVKRVADFFDGPFYVIYADNFSQWDITRLQGPLLKNGAVGSVAVHWREDVTQSGMIEFDEAMQIKRIVEKPKQAEVTSHYVSAGFFCLDPKVFDYIPAKEFCDFGFHVLPEMLRNGEKIFAVRMDDWIIGVDTKAAYERANQLALKLRNDR